MRNIHDIVMQKYSLKNKQELETMEFQEFVYQHIPGLVVLPKHGINMIKHWLFSVIIIIIIIIIILFML